MKIKATAKLASFGISLIADSHRVIVSILIVRLSYGARKVLSYTRHKMQNFLAFRDHPIIPLRCSPWVLHGMGAAILRGFERNPIWPRSDFGDGSSRELWWCLAHEHDAILFRGERAVKQTKKHNERPFLIMRRGGEGTINERSVESHTLQGTMPNVVIGSVTSLKVTK